MPGPTLQEKKNSSKRMPASTTQNNQHDKGSRHTSQLANKRDEDNPLTAPILAAVNKTTEGYPTNFEVHYLTSKREVNNALKHIVDRVIGFDMEYVPRKATEIDKLFNEVLWDIVGLCMIQIAKGDDVWVINMTKVRGIPAKLKRIITSETIAKIGVGIVSDLQVIWADLGLEMRNVVDASLIARLLLIEKYTDGLYTNLSMVNAVHDILGFTISKEICKLPNGQELREK
ncbi:ribonuclease H-like domain-containing protein [Mycena crocata]|nr:ribonuclease H-like domain-containing protein [Mycena crocata]